MAFTAYHNLDGSVARTNELLAIGDISRQLIKSIQFTNVDDATVTIDLFIYKDSTDASVSEKYYFLKDVSIPVGVGLILDNSDLLNFDNSSSGYSLHAVVGSSDTVDVIIRKG